MKKLMTINIRSKHQKSFVGIEKLVNSLFTCLAFSYFFLPVVDLRSCPDAHPIYVDRDIVCYILPVDHSCHFPHSRTVGTIPFILKLCPSILDYMEDPNLFLNRLRFIRQSSPPTYAATHLDVQFNPLHLRKNSSK